MKKVVIVVAVLVLLGWALFRNPSQAGKQPASSENIDLNELLQKAKAVTKSGRADFPDQKIEKMGKGLWADLSQEDRRRLTELIADRSCFLDSSPDLKYPETMNHFFTEKIYGKLRGNWLLGYCHDEGFTQNSKRVGLDIVKSTSQVEPFLPDYKKVLLDLAPRLGLEWSDAADIRLGVCIVSVSPELTQESYYGLVGEAYWHNRVTKKSLFLRYMAGKKSGLREAMVDFNLRLFAWMLGHEEKMAGAT